MKISPTIVDRWAQGQREGEFADFFERVASGLDGKPDIQSPRATMSLFHGDPAVLRFSARHAQLQGVFDQHYLASIPFALEEECRFGDALLGYSQHLAKAGRQPATLLCVGMAEGTLARTVADLADGQVRALTTTSTAANLTSFRAHGVPQHARLFLGPFFLLDGDRIAELGFSDGFDVVVEDTTFQMYGPERYEQILWVRQFLRADGVAIFIEKFDAASDNEYAMREEQKDREFKTRYFSSSGIDAKRTQILTSMKRNQVTVPYFLHILKGMFKYSAITWNSGNFYRVIASDSVDAINALIGNMLPPCIPPEYCYITLPSVESGGMGLNPRFRQPAPVRPNPGRS